LDFDFRVGVLALISIGQKEIKRLK
jgi:hypothetical protein